MGSSGPQTIEAVWDTNGGAALPPAPGQKRQPVAGPGSGPRTVAARSGGTSGPGAGGDVVLTAPDAGDDGLAGELVDMDMWKTLPGDAGRPLLPSQRKGAGSAGWPFGAIGAGAFALLTAGVASKKRSRVWAITVAQRSLTHARTAYATMISSLSLLLAFLWWKR